MNPQPNPAGFTLPFASVADYVFNFATVIAMDFTAYKEGEDNRRAELYLIDGVCHVFTNERADQFLLWYLRTTGQNRIEPAVPSIPPDVRDGLS